MATALFVGLFGACAASAAPTLLALTTAEAPIGTPGTTTPSSGPGYVNSNSSAINPVGNASGSAFARDSGAYAVSSSVEGKGQSSANAKFSQTISNASGSAQHYYLTMKIYGGSIGLSVFDPAGLAVGEFLRSGYSAGVFVGGNAVFQSAATVEKDGITNVGHCTHTGAVLTGAGSCGAGDGFYGWSTDYYTVDLGVLGNGDQFDVMADLNGASVANVGTYDFSGGGGYGYGCGETIAEPSTAVVIELCSRFKGQARQFYGDPQDTNATFEVTQTAVGTVPVPATGLLLGLGLGALGWTRRRRTSRIAPDDKGAPPTA